MPAWIACLALIALDDPIMSGSMGDIGAAYEVRRQATARTPDDQVRLAYWCEAHGLAAERLRHLALAVLADPDHAAARGLMGLVSRDRRWLKPEAVADRVKADPALIATLAEYDARRATTAYTAEAQWDLAAWAEARGLAEQARAHLTAVVRLDPRREAAWKRLGYRKVNGRWANDTEVAAAKADAEAQRTADRKWKPLLEKWRAQLARPGQRAEAEAGLQAVTDPRAVGWVARTFLGGGKADAEVALRVLAQIDSAAASRLIAGIALNGEDADQRRVALEILRGRDPRDYAAPLIAPLRERIDYQVEAVAGPGSVGRLIVKEPKKKVQRLYATPAVPGYLAWLAQQSGGAPVLSYEYQGAYVELGTKTMWSQHYAMNQFFQLKPGTSPAANLVPQVDAFLNPRAGQGGGEPTLFRDFFSNHPNNFQAHAANPGAYKNNLYGVTVTQVQGDTTTPLTTQTDFPLAAMIAEYQKTAVAAQRQIARDVAQIDDYNRQVDRTNESVTQILRTISGEDHGTDRMEWTRWLVRVSGYAMIGQDGSQDVPTITIDVPLAYQPQAVPIGATTYQTGPPVVSAPSYQVGFDSRILSCFGAGTPVRAITGPRAIETLRPGDLVLTQEMTLGTLRYRPILAVHHNPPSPTFLIRMGTDTIVSSPFHRFWKVGQGWVMARDIRVGDHLRLLGSSAIVEEYRPGEIQPVFNLDVADDADFFAGASAALVHDNTLPDPRLIPFDRLGAADKTLAAGP